MLFVKKSIKNKRLSDFIYFLLPINFRGQNISIVWHIHIAGIDLYDTRVVAHGRARKLDRTIVVPE